MRTQKRTGNGRSRTPKAAIQSAAPAEMPTVKAPPKSAGRVAAAPDRPPRATRAAAPAPKSFDRPPPGHYTAHAVDRAFKANLARVTGGMTPAGLASLQFEWLAHLALSPGKHMELAEKAGRKLARLTQ